MIKKIIKNISNIPGWRTNPKIVVIESDDWGSIRMSSNESYNTLKKAGLSLDKGAGARYNKYETLASKEDLKHLFEVLKSVKDKNGSSAKMTAVSLVANPDFKKIKEDNFHNYYYEPFTKTLERYGKHGAFALWQQGIKENIFIPEFHGREHLNIQAWLRALRQGDKEALLAFEYGIWGYNRKKGIGFQAAFDLEFASDLEQQKQIVKEGLVLFEKLHGYQANFFVPPNGPINDQLEKTAAENGIKFMSTPKIQQEVLGEGRTKRHFRYLGKKNKHNQLYITRNAFFEPSGSRKDEVAICLKQIEMAFKYNKPAIISSHRVNFIGGLNEENRTTSLEQFSTLLKTIVKTWPEVEFMTSTELGLVIDNKKHAK
jgi:hypothetical protein